MTNNAEGKWVSVRHEDVREGDIVRVTLKEGPQTTTTEGKVTSYDPHGYRQNKSMWCIENFENYYGYEFEAEDDEDVVPTLERLVVPFTWPSKVGAVVKLKDADGEYTAVMVYKATSSAEDDVWYTIEWGLTDVGELGNFEDLTILSEGVSV